MKIPGGRNCSRFLTTRVLSQTSDNPKAGNGPKNLIFPTEQFYITKKVTDPSTLLMGGKESCAKMWVPGILLGSLSG